MSINHPDECRLDYLESQIPAASGEVFSLAYTKTIQAGLSVIVSENGAIYEVFPDGRRQLVKTIAPPAKAQPGQKIKLQ